MTPATAPSLVERVNNAIRWAEDHRSAWLQELMLEVREALTASPAPEDAELVKELEALRDFQHDFSPALSLNGCEPFVADLVRRVLECLSRPASDPWCFDMEKAPGDGTAILATDGKLRCIVVARQEAPAEWLKSGNAPVEIDTVVVGKLIAWMHLPAPPTPEKEGQP